MRAVRFDVSVTGFLAARSLGRVSESAVFGRLSNLGMEQVPDPEPPGPEWLRLRVLLSGICGTDLGNLTYSSSPAMEPFGSFPAVLGHEILAEVEAVGTDVAGLQPGQRVVVDPMISCAVRGYPDRCPSCGEGLPGTCERAGEEAPLRVDGQALAPGMTVGYHRDLPGGWGERLIAHRSQVFPVPDGLDDRAAVLTEPLSIGMHAALVCRPLGEGPILVIGSGPIALGTIWALRSIGFAGEIVGQTKRAHEARLARLLGASRVVSPGDEARQALVDTGASAYQPLVGPEVYSGGGFPLVFDCVGSRSSLDQSLRYAAPRGRVVLLGCAGEMKKIDLTFLWARELDVKGFVGYGTETWEGEEAHTFEITLNAL
ncbi:MAG: alcohol dehydrogenase catalytic domain-containing protein, partial [Longimicrobiales bacterium]|nr:alcohol dehydrogenase catalytic domain-containing protein [Longimicrobiales bacterium]